MFNFLKDKLKKAVGKFSKEVEKEAVVEKKEVLVEKTEAQNNKLSESDTKIDDNKKKGFFEKIFGKKDYPKKDDYDYYEESKNIIDKGSLNNKETLLNEDKEKGNNKISEQTIINQDNTKIIDIKDNKKTISNKEDNKDTEIILEKEEKNDKIEINDQKTKKDKESIQHDLRLDNEYKKERKDTKSFPQENNIGSIKEDIDSEKISYKDKESIQKEIQEETQEETKNKTSLKDLKKEIKEEEKKGFFTKITETFTKFQLSEERFEELFWDLEVVLLENNVAVEVIEKIKADMKKELLKGKISRKSVDEIIAATLKNSIIDLFDVDNINLIEEAKKKKPYIIAVIGVNGSGKTTSIAKLTHLFQKNGLSVVLSASDTFRAAAIQQLEEHANRLNTKLIKHDYNSDPAAVAFDAIKYAESKNIDVVIIDTAGRLHSNTNLMRELEKIVRICKPDIKIFVGESITGNDCVEQAKEFDRAVGIDAIILAKADVDEKGGAAISVSYVTKKPILYLGIGQSYDDLKEFDPRMIIESLEL
ncbi:MAG: hypothetical protein KatS3mg002_0901 [Candidatus Woesearchaeota archaeon]|nr:MAG: hypothetical protein KatS3mg002_0901 [Candidatus Woesearchaeota archaeon]